MFDQNFAIMSPEFRLLLASSIPFINDDEGDHLHTLCLGNVDWQRILYLINWHRLDGLSFYNLNQYARDTIPDSFSQVLHKRFKDNQHHELSLTAELLQLVKKMREKDLLILSIKGPILSKHLYGDLGVRYSKDIDILISPPFFEQADKTLLSLGYRRIFPNFEFTPRQKKEYMRMQKHFSYIHPVHQNVVELHWRLLSNPHYLSSTFEEGAMSRSLSIEFAKTKVDVLSEEDNFIYLCMHGALHGWYRLKWLCDIAAFLRTKDISIHWDNLASYSKDLGAQHSVAQASFLAHQLLNAPIPKPLQDLIHMVKGTRKLAFQGFQIMLYPEEKIFSTGQMKSIVHSFYRMKFRNNWHYKWHDWLRIWTEPQDWKEVSFPDVLFPLYYLLRPFLWLRRYFF